MTPSFPFNPHTKELIPAKLDTAHKGLVKCRRFFVESAEVGLFHCVYLCSLLYYFTSNLAVKCVTVISNWNMSLKSSVARAMVPGEC